MRNANRQRGSTIIEVMCAAAILLVAIVGLVAVMNTAASATAVGHRRTVGTHLRQAVVDRMIVTPRDRIEREVPTATWLVDTCYDVDSRPLAVNTAVPRANPFDCPTGTLYRTWYRVEPHATEVRRWTVLTYAERMNGGVAGCDAAHRFSSVACLGADVILTD
jgi:Tfp pilus assembly protein PilV